MPATVASHNYWDEVVYIPADQHQMLRHGVELTKVKLSLTESVVLYKRDDLELNSHPFEKRPYVVAFERYYRWGDQLAGDWHTIREWADVTLHPRIGGHAGALFRMTEMVDEYTQGQM